MPDLTCLAARSISSPIHSALQQEPFAARVLAAFDHACDLVTPNGDVIAIVALQIGDGPLNIVVDGKPEDFALLRPGTAARLQEANLQIGDVQINLAGAAVWEPRPDWNALRARRTSIERDLETLSSVSARLAAPESWWAEQDAISPPAQPVIQAALESVRAGWLGDLAQLQNGAARLAGLGNGLTPAGDDFLAGVMLWAWLAHPAPQSFCGAIVDSAAPRTTTLSAAFLHAAARGECDATWHQLLATLGTATDDELAAAIERVLAHGATSGADMLAGFLWMASVACPKLDVSS